MQNMAASRRRALSELQCLCSGIRPLLRLDGNLHREKELPTICKVQPDGKSYAMIGDRPMFGLIDFANIILTGFLVVNV